MEVDTDALTPPISGIPNDAETETETPNDDDSAKKIGPVNSEQSLELYALVTLHEAELLKPCWNPSVTEPLVPVNLPSVCALSEIQVGFPGWKMN